jgi:signal transduction histidine kinase
MPPDEADRVGAIFQGIAAVQSPFHRLENVNLHKDGRFVVLETSGVPILDTKGNLVGYRGIDRDITERVRAEQALREYAERLSILHEIDRVILAAQSLEAIAQAALRGIRQLVLCQRASIGLFDFEANEGVLLAVQVDGETGLGERTRIPLAGIAGIEELRQGKVRVTEDTLTLAVPPSVRQALQAGGMRSYIMAPLISQGELIGCLNLGAEIPRAFSLEQADVVQEVADSLAIAIQQTQLFESVKRRREQLRTLTARLAEAEEAERQRLARQLHDLVGQNLTALGINLNIIQAQMPEEAGPMVRSRLEDSQSLVEQTTERIRNVMADLRRPVLDDYGLLAALHWYGEQFARWADIAVAVEGEEPLHRPAPRIENALFRIAQEALTNVTKHAQATHVRVTVEVNDGTLCLIIADDGIGFDPTHPTEPDGVRGWGLLTMAERAEAVGGRCRIESNSRGGTRVVVEVAR